jgi:ribosomal RNA assembly protein|tara:strand:+ start:4968 stop:5471 length:504 start_codon:yes stop_codon:yes gene_type:complete
MHSEVVNIPRDRIAALIGSKGRNKKQIETRGKCKLNISSSGTVTIKATDAENLLSVKQVVEAIGRGFNPEAAVLLFREEYALEILDMNAYTKSKARLATLRSRVIGRKGAARRKLEQITGTAICIYGKTIGIIGKSEDAYLAQRAMEMILEGSNHVSVFRWIADQLQ